MYVHWILAPIVGKAIYIDKLVGQRNIKLLTFWCTILPLFLESLALPRTSRWTCHTFIWMMEIPYLWLDIWFMAPIDFVPLNICTDWFWYWQCLVQGRPKWAIEFGISWGPEDGYPEWVSPYRLFRPIWNREGSWRCHQRVVFHAKELFITTKTWDGFYDIPTAFKSSLSKLQLEYVDLCVTVPSFYTWFWSWFWCWYSCVRQIPHP